MFLSIIVPVYNVKKYLDECLNSILNCNLSNYEIILVNDGSTDGSEAVCMEYKNKYKEIILINKKNGGLSDARNSGLMVAKGKYIIFIDSDDYIVSKNFCKTINKLENLSLKNEDFDIFISDFFRVSDKKDIIDRINQIEATEEVVKEIGYINKFLEGYGCFWNSWRFMYRREFLHKNSFEFKKGFLCEDIDFSVKTLVRAKKIFYYHNPYYCYRIARKLSIMSVVSLKRIDDYLNITKECVDLLSKDKPFFMERMIDKLIIEFILNLATIYEVNKQEKDKALLLFENTVYILELSNNKKIKLISNIISVLGISRLAFILFVLKRIRRILKNAKKCFGKSEILSTDS